MKKFIISMLLMIGPLFTVMAQGIQEPNYGYGHLGVLCYVSVDIDNDPVTADGFLKYTIPTPSESIDDVVGPVGCYLLNYLGPRSTVDLYVRRSHLELAIDSAASAQVPFEIFVNKWMNSHGDTYHEQTGVYCYQCHYTVILLTNSLN